MSMTTPGTPRLIEEIRGYHAHVYYEPDTRPQAALLRAWIAERFAVRIGRWHDAPVGPHTRAMYLVVFEPAAFATIVPWLALNRAGLSVLIHPETGDDLADHTEHALWLGPRLPIDENALR